MGNAIYKPKGKAGEYAEWACNLYVGCSNDCSYCYCKRGVLAHAMGGKTATLKKCFRDEVDALKKFTAELERNIDELRRSSLFFTFTSDPMIPETRQLTMDCIAVALDRGVKVQVLTKNADFVNDRKAMSKLTGWPDGVRDKIAWGFTLTGRDDLEPGASLNTERIRTMRYLHDAGFLTFASLEPVIDPVSTLAVFNESMDCCDLFKVGLQSGRSGGYDRGEVIRMVHAMEVTDKMLYLKKSVTDYLGVEPHKPVDVFRLDHYWDGGAE